MRIGRPNTGTESVNPPCGWLSTAASLHLRFSVILIVGILIELGAGAGIEPARDQLMRLTPYHLATLQLVG